MVKIIIDEPLPSDEERDEAFVKGWKSELIGSNPYPDNTILGRVFVEGWCMREKIKRLRLRWD